MKSDGIRLQFSVNKEALSGGYSRVMQTMLSGLQQTAERTDVNSNETKLKIDKEFEQLKYEANHKLVFKTNIFEGTTNNSQDKVRRLAHGLMRDRLFRQIISATYKDILKADPEDIIDSPSHFEDADSARAYLITKLAIRDTPEKNGKIEINLTDDSIQKYSEEIDKAIDFARSIQYLDGAWDDLILIYLANPEAEPDDEFANKLTDRTSIFFRPVEVLDIDSGYATIRFDRGMTRKDFIKTWDILQPILQPGPSRGEVDWLKTRLAVLHYQEKMSYREIAKIYYPEYFEKRDRSREAIDLVRRTLERMDSITIDVS